MKIANEVQIGQFQLVKQQFLDWKTYFETRENGNSLLKKFKPYDFPHLTTIQSFDERCKRKY